MSAPTASSFASYGCRKACRLPWRWRRGRFCARFGFLCLLFFVLFVSSSEGSFASDDTAHSSAASAVVDCHSVMTNITDAWCRTECATHGSHGTDVDNESANWDHGSGGSSSRCPGQRCRCTLDGRGGGGSAYMSASVHWKAWRCFDFVVTPDAVRVDIELNRSSTIHSPSIYVRFAAADDEGRSGYAALDAVRWDFKSDRPEVELRSSFPKSDARWEGTWLVCVQGTSGRPASFRIGANVVMKEEEKDRKVPPLPQNVTVLDRLPSSVLIEGLSPRQWRYFQGPIQGSDVEISVTVGTPEDMDRKCNASGSSSSGDKRRDSPPVNVFLRQGCPPTASEFDVRARLTCGPRQVVLKVVRPDESGAGSSSSSSSSSECASNLWYMGVENAEEDDPRSRTADVALRINANSCPNGCSGHGMCNPDTHECQCLTEWAQKPDCSRRETVLLLNQPLKVDQLPANSELNFLTTVSRQALALGGANLVFSAALDRAPRRGGVGCAQTELPWMSVHMQQSTSSSKKRLDLDHGSNSFLQFPLEEPSPSRCSSPHCSEVMGWYGVLSNPTPYPITVVLTVRLENMARCPPPKRLDCAGSCAGDAVQDCSGVCQGSAFIDACGRCVGGKTGRGACRTIRVAVAVHSGDIGEPALGSRFTARGQELASAAKIAIDAVNRQIIPSIQKRQSQPFALDYKGLQVDVDCGGDPQTAVSKLKGWLKSLGEGSDRRPVALIGPPCPGAADDLARVFKEEEADIAIINPLAPGLSKHDCPVVSLMAAADSTGQAAYDLVQKMRWKAVAVLGVVGRGRSDEAIAAVVKKTDQLVVAGGSTIRIQKTVLGVDGEDVNLETVKRALEGIIRARKRVGGVGVAVILCATERDMAGVMWVAATLGMTTEEWRWIALPVSTTAVSFPNLVTDWTYPLRKKAGSEEEWARQVGLSMDGIVVIQAPAGRGSIYNDLLSIWSSSSTEARSNLQMNVTTTPEPVGLGSAGMWTGQVFDSVLVTALAIASTLNPSGTTSSNPSARCVGDSDVVDAIRKSMEFDGTTGPVAFDDGLTRRPAWDIVNMRRGSWAVVGEWESSSGVQLFKKSSDSVSGTYGFSWPDFDGAWMAVQHPNETVVGGRGTEPALLECEEVLPAGGTAMSAMRAMLGIGKEGEEGGDSGKKTGNGSKKVGSCSASVVGAVANVCSALRKTLQGSSLCHNEANGTWEPQPYASDCGPRCREQLDGWARQAMVLQRQVATKEGQIDMLVEQLQNATQLATSLRDRLELAADVISQLQSQVGNLTKGLDLPRITFAECDGRCATRGGSQLKIFGQIPKHLVNSTGLRQLFDELEHKGIISVVKNYLKGAPLDMAVKVGGKECRNLTLRRENDSAWDSPVIPLTALPFCVECTAPPGAGRGVPVVVRMAGVTSMPGVTTFAGPVVERIEPEMMLVPSMQNLTIGGSNFGDDVEAINVTVDGMPCSEVQILEAHSKLSCTVHGPSPDVGASAGATVPYKGPVVVSVAGQQSTSSSHHLLFYGCPGYLGGNQVCSGHGSCYLNSTARTAECVCEKGYYGPGCGARCPGYGACNAHGACDDGAAGSGICSCKKGYTGVDCSFRVAASDCSGAQITSFALWGCMAAVFGAFIVRKLWNSCQDIRAEWANPAHDSDDDGTDGAAGQGGGVEEDKKAGKGKFEKVKGSLLGKQWAKV